MTKKSIYVRLFILPLSVWSFSIANAENIKMKTFDNLSLNAKLYLPEKLKKLNPAILIIEGSGKSGFTDEPEKSPFNQLAGELAKSGFITLKYNKRGSGENSSNGSFWKSTFTIDNKDAQAALDILKSHKKVNPEQIFLIGHSFGGPQSLVLSQKNKVAGIIMLTSTVKPTELLMHEQTEVIMVLQGLPEKDIQKALKDLDKQLSEVKSNSYKCVEPDCSMIENAPVLDKSIQVSWLNEVLNMNFLKIAKEQPSPVLFIFGHSDFVIPSNEEKFVKENLIGSPPKKVTLKVLEKLDHFMVENESKKDSLAYAHKAQKEKIFKPISQELVKTIRDWILR